MNALQKQAKELKAKGYRVIADGKHSAYKRWCKSLEEEINSIRGEPRIYRNMLDEISIDFDCEEV